MSAQLELIAATETELTDALRAAALPTDDLLEQGRYFFRFRDGGQTIGYGGLEVYGKSALLRSVVVLPEQRGKGLGRALTSSLLQQAFNAGARNVYLLTTTAAPFFEAAGFHQIERTTAPEDIRNTRQASSICSSAPMLARTLEA